MGKGTVCTCVAQICHAAKCSPVVYMISSFILVVHLVVMIQMLIYDTDNQVFSYMLGITHTHTHTHTHNTHTHTHTHTNLLANAVPTMSTQFAPVVCMLMSVTPNKTTDQWLCQTNSNQSLVGHMCTTTSIFIHVQWWLLVC